MKKLTGGFLVVAGIVGALLLGAEETGAKVRTDVILEDEYVSASNVGDGQEYAYEIVEINGDEVHGVPLNKASEGNRGLFIYKDEIGFDVEVGDGIVVVWGEYEDEFALVDRAVYVEGKGYLSEKSYKKYMFVKMLRFKYQEYIQNHLKWGGFEIQYKWIKHEF